MTYYQCLHLAMYHTLPRPVPFIWQCVLRYHDQCLSPGNVSCGTMTSVFHLAIQHTLPRPVPFIWQCVLRYHDQCLSPGNVSYGTITGAFHMCEIHWLCYRMAHCHVALVVVPYGALSGERHWSWYRKTHCQMKGTDRDSVWYKTGERCFVIRLTSIGSISDHLRLNNNHQRFHQYQQS
jgi:hypothetical protein